MLRPAAIGLAAGALAACATTGAAERYLIIGAEDGEAFALREAALRPAPGGKVHAQILFLTITTRDVQDRTDKVVGQADYQVSDILVDCRRPGYVVERTRSFLQSGKLVHTETPRPEAGWMNEITGLAVRLACTPAERAKVPVKSYASMLDFVEDVRRRF